ncbi:MAG: Uncharacterized protein AUREO_014760 [Aureobasidium pullulans]|nr:MAG: Uncharacterized protein AUREO_014760 [Aureobasidium pullulans]THV78509.1 hypothetical protein D6D29_07608 [Aureobasidium pullulans]
MALSGRDSLLRCCRSAFNQASRDARIFYPRRQLSLSTRPSQLSPRSASVPRFAPFSKKDILLSPNTRAFSASSQHATKAIINPRKNENGEDMVIDILPRAVNRLHAISTKENNPSLCLRVAVESGGCHGFQYLMSTTTLEEISKEEDTVFESEDGKGARVVIDEPSLELLSGSKIDYTMELIGSQFKVTGIPGATSSCGCGSSFDIQA